jgi:hypothetical protein
MIFPRFSLSAGGFLDPLRQTFGVEPILIRFAQCAPCVTGSLIYPLVMLSNHILRVRAAIICQLGPLVKNYLVLEVPTFSSCYGEHSRVALVEADYIAFAIDFNFTEMKQMLAKSLSAEARLQEHRRNLPKVKRLCSGACENSPDLLIGNEIHWQGGEWQQDGAPATKLVSTRKDTNRCAVATLIIPRRRGEDLSLTAIVGMPIPIIGEPHSLRN